MKSQLATARDKWLLSEEGEACSHGQVSGQFLCNRIKRAFEAGWNAYQQAKVDAIATALEAAAKKVRTTGNHTDLQAYLKLRRDLL